jgi:hypothetical protein
MEITNNCKKDPNGSQATTDALAYRKEIQADDRKQTAIIQSNPQAHMDIWHTTLGLYQAVKHKNHTTSTVKNTTNGIQRTAVRKQQNTPRKLRHTIRSRRSQTTDK